MADQTHPYGGGWAGEPHECQCDGPDDSCPACSEIPDEPVTAAARLLGRRGGAAGAGKLMPVGILSMTDVIRQFFSRN